MIVLRALLTLVVVTFTGSSSKSSNKERDSWKLSMEQKVEFIRSKLQIKEKSSYGDEDISQLISQFQEQKDDTEKPDWLEQDEGKYFSRTCDSDRGMWGNDLRENLQYMLKYASQIMGFKEEKKLTVLDWGAGCGQMTQHLKELYDDVDLIRFGLDLNPENMKWAKEKGHVDYAVGKDGSDISWIDDKSFDRIISVAAIYHLPPAKQRSLIQQLVRKLKKNGVMWIGWQGSHGYEEENAKKSQNS